MNTKISLKEEDKKKKKDIEDTDSKKIITEDGTLSMFGFNDNYNSGKDDE